MDGDDAISSDEERWMLGTGMDITDLIRRYPEDDEEADEGPSPATIERRERLERWFSRLRWEIVFVPNPSREEVLEALREGVVWAQWNNHAPRDVSYEAMELLALLAVVDHEEWKRVVAEKWPEAAVVWFHYFQGRRFRLGYQVETMRRGVFTKTGERFMVGDVLFHTEPRLSLDALDYISMRQELEDLANELHPEVRKDLCIPVRAKLNDDGGSRAHPFEELWLEVVQLASLQVTRDRSFSANVLHTSRWSPLFRLVEVDLRMFESTWTRKDLLYARQIATCGVHVRPLRLLGLTIDTKTARVVMPTLHQFLGIGEAVDTFQVTRSVAIEERSSPQTLDSLFSAILASTSVRELHVSNTAYNSQAEDRERLWKWLAITVFSDDAPTHIETIELLGRSMTLDDVYVLGKMVHVQNGVDTLYAKARVKPVSGVRLVVVASKFQLLCPLSRDGLAADDASVVSFQTPLTNLRIINDGVRDSKWISVLLPGWGQAWVTRADASLSSAVECCAPDSSRAKLHVVIDGPGRDNEQVHVAFFQTIGHTVRKITFKHCGGTTPLSTTAARNIVQACPGLEELEMADGCLPSLDAIAQWYSNETCRLRHLVLMLRDIHDQEDVRRFFGRLADANHPIARTLQTFIMLAHSRLPSLKPSVLRVLEKNRTLEEFDLEWHRDLNADEEAIRTYEAAVEQHNGEPCIKSLPLPAKLAFLSVVWGDNHREAPPKRRRNRAKKVTTAPTLDTSVVTAVFQFAGQWKTRLARSRFI